MNQDEGVTKFQLRYTKAAPVAAAAVRELNAWRQVLFQLNLIGCDPARYGGYAYGNLSVRIPPYDAGRFIVSGSQTGDLAVLSNQEYATVVECYPERNLVVAEGPLPPSSESMTHGTVYALDSSLRVVFHVHSPQLWQQAAALNLPITRPEVAYGTPQMAREVERLFAETAVRDQRIFAMGGHEDGIVTFGRSAEEAGVVLVSRLAQAYAGSSTSR